MGVGTTINFTAPKMRSLCIVACFFMLGWQLSAQPTSEEPAKLVLELLAADSTQWPENAKALLSEQSWESLAYWDPGTPRKIEQLFEAVPDVYRFEQDAFRVRFFQAPKGRELIQGKYRLEDETWIVFTDGSGGRELDRWKLLYLDRNYLAVDMDGLRVFFVPPDNDPF